MYRAFSTSRLAGNECVRCVAGRSGYHHGWFVGRRRAVDKLTELTLASAKVQYLASKRKQGSEADDAKCLR